MKKMQKMPFLSFVKAAAVNSVHKRKLHILWKSVHKLCSFANFLFLWSLPENLIALPFIKQSYKNWNININTYARVYCVYVAFITISITLLLMKKENKKKKKQKQKLSVRWNESWALDGFILGELIEALDPFVLLVYFSYFYLLRLFKPKWLKKWSG